jgi:hypothetical protein
MITFIGIKNKLYTDLGAVVKNRDELIVSNLIIEEMKLPVVSVVANLLLIFIVNTKMKIMRLIHLSDKTFNLQ